ncbi:chemotaxis protein CheR, partial [candidate division KSB3 bacterium]|nr:chemotaxis protein CheR [candidate division KSB3 bacterium]MBD3324887.1 chemotaxis protein CheR [candidate division KSB3 bacterium]
MTDTDARGIEPSADDERGDFYIVGIGASAGGYEAIERFFRQMPPDSGMAFVVVQHLSPDFKSLMVELLSKHTAMELFRVEDGIAVRPNCVYLIPPRKTMTLFQGRLYLSDIEHEHGLNLPINLFLRSLAEDKMEKAIAIIFSGTGSDGTLGIREIKGCGGMVIAQDPTSAKFDGMPRSAIGTGLVDAVLSPEDMPDTLLRFLTQLSVSQHAPSGIMRGQKFDRLSRLLAILKQKKQIDFTQYKTSTILRRVEKRMGINQIYTIDEYISFFQQT